MTSKNTPGRCVAAEDKGHDNGHKGQRRDDQGEVLHEGHQLTEFEPVALSTCAPPTQTAIDNEELGDEGQDGVEQRDAEGGPYAGLRIAFGAAVEALLLELLADEALTTRTPARFSCSVLLTSSRRFCR